MIKREFTETPAELAEASGILSSQQQPNGDDTAVFENKLRPGQLAEYIGQEEIKRNLTIALEAAKKRGETLDHVLLHGPAGLGKTTLAFIIAHEMGGSLKLTSGPTLERQADLASQLTNLKEGDVLFIDEIHRMRAPVEEILYSAMEDYGVDIMIGKGPSARSIRINLPKFTLIGATTKMSLLSSPLRDRFGNIFKFAFYSMEEMMQIVTRTAQLLDFSITPQAAEKISACSRQTPRIANRLVKRIRDFAQYHDKTAIDEYLATSALTHLGVDQLGLDQTDRQILHAIVNTFSGGPVGLNTLSSALSEEEATIEDIYEPFLIKLGFLERTPRGRVVTQRGEVHLKNMTL